MCGALPCVKHERRQCTAIVETGTYLGTTTTFFAGSGLPVYTVETDPRYHGFAQMQLRRFRGRVHLSLGDSRVFLKLEPALLLVARRGRRRLERNKHGMP